MSKINWKVRAKSPQFWIGVAGAVASPVMAYYGVTTADLTTWQGIGNLAAQAIQNPFVLMSIGTSVLSFIGVLTDPTTKGIKDSEQAQEYEKPKG